MRLITTITMLLIFAGCDNGATPPPPAYFSCDESIGCQFGYTCDLTQNRCVSSADGGITPDQGLSDDAEVGGDASIVADMGMAGDVMPGTDAEMVADRDGDGVFDQVDNCADDSNSDQLDTDADGLGDVCDARPNHADFSLFGQFLLFGGLLVDDDYSVRGGGQSAHGVVSDGEFQLRGGFRP